MRQRHDIGAQCGATATNTTAKITNDNNANSIQQNQQNSPKLKRQLEVVSTGADGFPEDLDGYVEPNPYKNHSAAFVPNSQKVSTIHEHFHP